MPSSDRRRKPHASYSVYKAKTAEREILHQAALRKAATREEVELLNETLRRDLERLASDRGRKIAEIRGEVFP